MLLEVQWENCYTTWIYNFVAFYIAGICVHLFVCQNKSTCFQKLIKVFKCFLWCVRQMMLVVKRPAALPGASREAASYI